MMLHVGNEVIVTSDEYPGEHGRTGTILAIEGERCQVHHSGDPVDLVATYAIGELEQYAWCWHPSRGFYYYCSTHKPGKPESELRVVLYSEIIAHSSCMECHKPLGRQDSPPGTRTIGFA